LEAQTEINVSQRVDDSELGTLQWSTIVLCALCLIMDGFDVQAMGYVAPVLIREWGVPNSALGPVFSAGLFGVLRPPDARDSLHRWNRLGRNDAERHGAGGRVQS
jgi:hypothetical protein